MHSAGLEKYLPPERTDRSDLEHALQLYAAQNVPAGRDWDVRKLRKSAVNGFEVIWLQRGDYKNDEQHQFSCSVLNGAVYVNYGYGSAVDVQAHFDAYKNLVTNDAIGKILVRLATERLNGLGLRPNGGLYWIPENEVSLWNEYASCVETASGSSVTTAAWEANPSTLTAVRESLLSTVDAECARIMSDLSDGKIHDDIFFDNRSQDMKRLLERVSSVESALSVSLDDCRSRLQLVESVYTAATMASL
jgi:hypothetical protein